MSIGAIAALGFVALFLAVPVVIVAWSRSAKMFSGKVLIYDGPLGGEMEAGVVPSVPEEGLSADEKFMWNELTRVAWNMPSGKG